MTRRWNSDQWMESKEKKNSENVWVLKAGAERGAGVGAGLLRMRCCFAKVLSRTLIVFSQNSEVAVSVAVVR